MRLGSFGSAAIISSPSIDRRSTARGRCHLAAHDAAQRDQIAAQAGVLGGQHVALPEPELRREQRQEQRRHRDRSPFPAQPVRGGWGGWPDCRSNAPSALAVRRARPRLGARARAPLTKSSDFDLGARRVDRPPRRLSVGMRICRIRERDARGRRTPRCSARSALVRPAPAAGPASPGTVPRRSGSGSRGSFCDAHGRVPVSSTQPSSTAAGARRSSPT